VRSEYLDFSVVVAAEALYDKLKEKGLWKRSGCSN
jgi:hypothetical protein